MCSYNGSSISSVGWLEQVRLRHAPHGVREGLVEGRDQVVLLLAADARPRQRIHLIDVGGSHQQRAIGAVEGLVGHHARMARRMARRHLAGLEHEKPRHEPIAHGIGRERLLGHRHQLPVDQELGFPVGQ